MASFSTATSMSPEERKPGHGLSCRTRLQYLYLLRVPILIGGTLFFLPILSLYVSRELLGNLFVLTSGNIFWTILATVMLCFSIIVTWRVVLLNGKGRFGIQQGLTVDVVSIRTLVAGEMLGAPMWLAAIFANDQAKSPALVLQRIAVVLAALVTAHALGFLVLLLSVWISPRYHHRPENRFPLPFKWMRDWIGQAYDKDWCSDETRKCLGDLAKSLPKAFRAGYFDSRTGLFYPGQWLSLLMLFCSFVLYELIGWGHAHLSGRFGVPAIGYVILLLIFLNWFFSIGAFFLDRYRFPLLLALLGFVSASNLTWKSDHFYETRARQELAAATPADILRSPIRTAPDREHPHGRVTLVATAGGGIQAAAWTAQVLTGLQRELQLRSENTPVNFAKSIAAISSVSGGAVGTMFFVSQYKKGGQSGFIASDAELESIVQMSEAPALDEVAWGMLYPDFARIVFPYLKLSRSKLIDRGWALEDAWRRRADLPDTLGQWRLGVSQGWRPASIFNATVVESGEPLVLATTDLQTSTSTGLGRRTFSQLLPGYDIPVVTAVRLAASFPYVTPAARALLEESQPPALNHQQIADLQNNSTYHIVDGGYYDNYGVNSLLAWLDEALAAQSAGEAPDILLIQIRSFPSEAKSPAAKTRGWLYQAYAPASALMRVRTTGQLVRDQEAIELFRQRWQAQGVHIRLATFEFAGNDAPLSWKMNPKQIEAIAKEWKKRVSGENNQDWIQAECFFLPLDQDCNKPGQPLNKGPW